MSKGSSESNGTERGIKVFPDEILLRHVRAASAEAKNRPSSGKCQDFNNNVRLASGGTTDPLDRRYSDISTSSGGELIPANPTGQVTRLHHHLEESFRKERKNLLGRIRELEIELETLNSERQEEEERLGELDQRNHSLSQELTKALLKNAVLLDENAALRSVQHSLATRVSSMEDKLQRLDTPSQEVMNSLLKRLEKREYGLKNQAKRLAQLESYYTRELNLISYAAGRVGVPEIREDDSVTVIHPPRPTQPQPPIEVRSTYPTHPFDPPQLPLMATEKFRTLDKEAKGRARESSYSELYYQTITDKAMNLIKRESGSTVTLESTTSETDPDNQGPKIQGGKTTLHQNNQGKSENSVISNEEEDMLKLLFYKF